MVQLLDVLWLVSAVAVFGAPLQDDQEEQDGSQFIQQVVVKPRAVFDEDFMEEIPTPYPETVVRNRRKPQRKYIYLTSNEERMFPMQSEEELGYTYSVNPRAAVNEDFEGEIPTSYTQAMAKNSKIHQRKYIFLDGNEESFFPIQLDEDLGYAYKCPKGEGFLSADGHLLCAKLE